MTRHPKSLTHDYVFRVYEQPKSARSPLYRMDTANACSILMMVSHEGFHWNDELFVSPYRRGPGAASSNTRTVKSADRIQREDRVSSTTSCIHHHHRPSAARRGHQRDNTDDNVIDIQLTEADCNIWP